MLRQLEHVATLPTIRLGMRLYLLTMVRKSELQDAIWDEVDFENAVWTIPKERMKRSKAHNVYLSQPDARHLHRAKDLRRKFAIRLPSRYDADAPMSRATFNRSRLRSWSRPRRRACRWSHSRFTISGEGFNAAERTGLQQRLDREVPGARGWPLVARRLQQGGIEVQRRHMMQEWSNIIDAWVAGENMFPSSSHRRCRSWSSTQRFHRPRAP